MVSRYMLLYNEWYNWLLDEFSTLCPRYWDSLVNGDPASVLVNGTPRYPDKKTECPVNECPDKGDRVYSQKHWVPYE